MKEGKTTQITLVTPNGESQIDGKTVKHAFELQYSGFFISFTDGTWGLLPEQRGNSEPITIETLFRNISYYDNYIPILVHLVEAGVLGHGEADKWSKELQSRGRKRLEERIKQNTEDISRCYLELEKLDKCPACGK